MNLIKRCFLVIAFTGISILSHGQDLDKILELHRSNLERLYRNRGVDEWLLGNVKTGDLISVLNRYSQNVGVMIYSHINDSLIINLIGKRGVVFSTKYYFTKDSLISEIDRANRYFSGEYLDRAPIKRGIRAINYEEKGPDLQESFRHLNAIFLPFKDTLMNYQHLIIIPTLNIAILPFAAFKMTEEKYLVDYMSYSIAPSLFEFMASEYINSSQMTQTGHQVNFTIINALIVANPDFPDPPDWNFPGLPGTLTEAKYITSSLDTSVFTLLTGADATKKRILEAICDYDLLYFATHGISDENDPLEKSFLVLADDKYGSYLTAKEIQDIRFTCKLNADLVVLSACQTGLGKNHEGGIIGLSRAFQIAGANHVVVSLWSINDEHTAKLMGFFFDELQKGGYLMPHEAMRSAMLKFKKEVDGNPNFWAAFSILGIPY